MTSQTSPAPAQERSERASDRADAAASPAPATGRRILFGAAYYDEYTPASAGPDRLTRDMEMMVEADFTISLRGGSASRREGASRGGKP